MIPRIQEVSGGGASRSEGLWRNIAEPISSISTGRASLTTFTDIPDVPKFGETLADVGQFQKADLIPATDLKSVFELIHNHIYANEGLLKDKVFTEMLKIIFVKMVDETRSGLKCDFRITEPELRDVEDGKVTSFTDRLTDLFEQVKKEYSDVFAKHESLNLAPTTLGFVVSQLQKYNLRETKADIKGTAFQTFVSAHQRGDRGEFFTPHPVLELMVEMVNPGDSEMFLDPACGSGGFLVYGMNQVWARFRKNPKVKDIALIKYAHNYIRGIDFNPDLARVAKMYMVLYDDGHTGIFSANALESWPILQRRAMEAGVAGIAPSSMDLILTNPPFGTKGKVTDKRILGEFDLGHKWKRDKVSGRWVKTHNLVNGQIPDILFVERCLQFLTEGGRVGIVLPNSDLNNSSLEHVRQYIMDRGRILAVVGLPVGTFMSAGSNPQSSVVFVHKLPKKEVEHLNATGYPIFMARIGRIGYDLTTKTAPILYKKDQFGDLVTDGKGRPIVDTDVPDVVMQFLDFRRRYGLKYRRDESL